MNIKCRKNLYGLCNHIGGNSDELMLLECIQNLKPNEVSGIDDECRQAIWDYILNITNNLNIERLAKKDLWQRVRFVRLFCFW